MSTNMLMAQSAAMHALVHELLASIARVQVRCEQRPEAATLDAVTMEMTEMSSLVESMIGCLQGMRGTFEPVQWIDADSLLGQLVDTYRAAGRVIEMEGRIGAPVAVCPGALSRVVRNLLDGASRTGAAVRVQIAADSTQLAVTVANRASGVNPGPRSPGAPCADTEPARPGFGLGLSIARRLAQAMRGDLKLRSSDEGWLEWRLSLPLARPPTIRS